MFIYHITNIENLESIKQHGLNNPLFKVPNFYHSKEPLLYLSSKPEDTNFLYNMDIDNYSFPIWVNLKVNTKKIDKKFLKKVNNKNYTYSKTILYKNISNKNIFNEKNRLYLKYKDYYFYTNDINTPNTCYIKNKGDIIGYIQSEPTIKKQKQILLVKNVFIEPKHRNFGLSFFLYKGLLLNKKSHGLASLKENILNNKINNIHNKFKNKTIIYY